MCHVLPLPDSAAPRVTGDMATGGFLSVYASAESGMGASLSGILFDTN